MSQGNYKAAFIEHFHGMLFESFHKYRNKNKLGTTFSIDGNIFSMIIVDAKKRLWEERPESKDAGFESLKQEMELT